MKPIFWYGLLITAAAVALVAYHLKTKPKDTDPIDGGVQHYEDSGAPKIILSSTITDFSCQASALNVSRQDSNLAGYIFTLKASEKEGYYCCYNRSQVREEFSFCPDEAFFTALQAIVAKYDLARFNGISYRVSGLPPHYGATLSIGYDSGENIYSSNNQSNFIPLSALEEMNRLFLSYHPGK